MSVKLRNKSEEVFNMTVRTGNYMIYKMYNKENGEYITEFFLPDSDLHRMVVRLATLASYKEKGYKVAGILYVDKEAYLNAKLTDTVEEYIYMDKSETELRFQFRRGQISRELYVESLELIRDHKWTLMKKLSIHIRRMIREDFNIENEIALQLYDEYLKAIL